MSYSQSTTATFNRTNAKYIATKIAADLHRMQQTYGWPSDATIIGIIDEMTELLPGGYVQSLEVGFSRNGTRVVSLRYTVRSDGSLGDDRPGGIPRGVDISDTEHVNRLWFSSAWSDLSAAERAAIEAKLPYTRVDADALTDGAGRWTQERTYSSNGTGTVRDTFRPY